MRGRATGELVNDSAINYVPVAFDKVNSGSVANRKSQESHKKSQQKFGEVKLSGQKQHTPSKQTGGTQQKSARRTNEEAKATRRTDGRPKQLNIKAGFEVWAFKLKEHMWLNWFKTRDLLGVSFQRFPMVSNWKPLETQTSSFFELVKETNKDLMD